MPTTVEGFRELARRLQDTEALVLIRERRVAALASAAPGVSRKRLKAYYKASK